MPAMLYAGARKRIAPTGRSYTRPRPCRSGPCPRCSCGKPETHRAHGALLRQPRPGIGIEHMQHRALDGDAQRLARFGQALRQHAGDQR